MKIYFTASVLVVGMMVGVPAQAADYPNKHRAWDRIEDRIDRRESRLDRRVTHGPRDRFEDRVDRWEDRRDRMNKPVPKKVRQWERRSWKRRWGG